MVYTIFSLTGRIVQRVGAVERTIREAPQAWARIEKYLALIDQAPSFNEEGVEPEGLGGAIEMKHVTFAYPGHPPVLDDFSIAIEQGKITAFVGASGSGKTTVGRLLLRAYNYDSGSITIGGTELSTIAANYLREHIGVVEQHVDLFDDTVRENILIGAEEEKREEVNARIDEIAAKARITEFAHRLGDLGYDAVVGERGLKLSGGERQRVGIARAIAKDPTIYLFDEATASLDAVNEKHVMDAVYAVSKGKTTIIIAHRLSTVRHADKIVVMERGRVVAEGTHESLMEHSVHYQTLVKHQLEETTS
jgi:ABC-type multidrug transport system fused ATPase/permease subunit